MTANRALAAQRDISEETCKLIDELHEEVDKLIPLLIESESDEESARDILNLMDGTVQKLWGFEEDPRYFTYFKKYQFNKEWAGRSFKCNTTGQIFTVPTSVAECQFFQWGEAFLDTGRLNAYSRFSNCTEISKGE